jgi:hypothetical protein
MIKRLTHTAGVTRPSGTVAPARWRLIVSKNDILVINGMELDAAILREIVSPSKRVLWAFVKQGGDIKPRCYSEDEVIWLTSDEVNLGTEV